VRAPICKWSRKGGAVTRIPSVDHPSMDGTDRILVCGGLSCWLHGLLRGIRLLCWLILALIGIEV
jgi:hypothetical protein